MEASFFKNASGIRIKGKPQFNSIVAGRDVHQTNHLGDTYNTNSNNTTKTVIKDSYNDNSKHIVNGSEHVESDESDDSEWTDGTSEDSDDSDRDQRRKPQPRAQKKQKTSARPGPSAKAKAKVHRRAAPADQEAQSEPDVRSATPPVRSPSPERVDPNNRPTPAHTVSAPAAPTQAVPEIPTPSPPPSATSAVPYLVVPAPKPQSANTSLTSLTPSIATSPGITQGPPSLELHRPASAPAPSTLGSSAGSSFVPSVAMQTLSAGVGQVDLSARYRYLVTQPETRYEIRRRLVGVAQSMPKDKFFVLKDQATAANTILGLIEGSKEKIQRKEEVVQLCLESHVIAFITIMAAETETPDDRKIYNLLKILNNVEELMDNVVHKNGLSRMHLFTKRENEKLVKSYRKELETWLRDFQNDKEATIDFALHKASKALSEALYMEQQYTIAVQEPPSDQRASSASPAPPNSQPQSAALSPGSISISDVSEAAVSLGSGSASVTNGEGSREPPAPRASSTSPALANSKPQRPALSSGSTSVSGISESAVSVGSGSAAAINARGSGNNQIHQNSHNNNSVNYYQGQAQMTAKASRGA